MTEAEVDGRAVEVVGIDLFPPLFHFRQIHFPPFSPHKRSRQIYFPPFS